VCKSAKCSGCFRLARLISASTPHTNSPQIALVFPPTSRAPHARSRTSIPAPACSETRCRIASTFSQRHRAQFPSSTASVPILAPTSCLRRVREVSGRLRVSGFSWRVDFEQGVDASDQFVEPIGLVDDGLDADRRCQGRSDQVLIQGKENYGNVRHGFT